MMITLLIVACIALFLLYAHWNTFRLVVREVEITVDKEGGFQELRIDQLSDLHMERLSNSPERIANQIADARADIVVMTGDYLDRYENKDKFMRYLDAIQAVEPKYGIWMVWGNHDHYLGDRIEDLGELIRSKGVNLLVNEWDAIEIEGKRLNIIGTDDYCLGKSDISASFKDLPDGINLVLSHDPNIVLDMEEHYEVDLLLSGHLHGGQFKIPGAFKLFPMGELPKSNVITGLHDINGKTQYISDGMCQSGLNVRLGTRPEITIHTLRTAA